MVICLIWYSFIRLIGHWLNQELDQYAHQEAGHIAQQAVDDGSFPVMNEDVIADSFHH